MLIEILKGQLSRFICDKAGDFALQSALMFGALAVAGALLAAPILDKVSREYAANNSAYGIDPITTASTGGNSDQSKRYVIRRSVLNRRETIICQSVGGRGC